MVRSDDLQISYDRHDCFRIDNVGYMWKIAAKDDCRSRTFFQKKICALRSHFNSFILEKTKNIILLCVIDFLDITGHYLHGNYVLHHAHAHWGTTSINGSEHLVNGKGFASEVNNIF